MNFVAIQMLLGDRAKYLGLIFAVAFSTFLMSHQSSIFAGIMRRTTSQIMDVPDANLWVMDRNVQFIDDVKPMQDTIVQRRNIVVQFRFSDPFGAQEQRVGLFQDKGAFQHKAVERFARP